MKPLIGLIALLTLSGCAELGTVLKMSKAPFICTFATAPEVETAAREVMADLPDSDKKTEAALALKIAKISADAGCTALKAVEAKPAQP